MSQTKKDLKDIKDKFFQDIFYIFQIVYQDITWCIWFIWSFFEEIMVYG